MTDKTAVQFVSKWAKKTAKRILSGELSEAEINKMRSLLARAINFTRTQAHCTAEEAWELIALLSDHPVRVSGVQARKGAQWLYNVTFTPRGTRRNAAVSAPFKDRDADLIRRLAAAEQPEFWLDGFDDRSNGPNVSLLPIYRAVCGDDYLVYAAGSWQSGGGIEVLRHA